LKFTRTTTLRTRSTNKIGFSHQLPWHRKSFLTFRMSLVWLGFITALTVIMNNGLPSASASELPDMGNSAGALISLEEEKRLGKEFMRNIRQTLTLVDDPVCNSYISTLGNRLASQVDTQDQTFTFFIVDDPSINAFAGPGGYIGVHTGLIKATVSESELASVLAHEIAHVVQRHLVRQLESDQHLSVPTMAAVVAAILLGKGNPDVAQAVIASSVAGRVQSQLSFSRLHEQEADRVGIKMLARAGYDPRSMADFFVTLQKANRFNMAGVPEFIMTHPVTATRIADARGRAAQIPYHKKSNKPSLDYQLFVDRINYLTHGQSSALEVKSNTQKPHKLDFAGRYARVLHLLDIKDFNKARQEISALIADDMLRIPYIITQADIENADQKPKAALGHLAQALMLYPQNQILSLLYAKTLMQAGQAKNAMLALQGFVRNKTVEDPVIYKTYAISAEKAGYQSEAYEAMADYYYLLGQTHTAIQHLNQAIKQSDTDAYRKLRLKARLDQLKQEMINKQADNKDQQ
jgi:predicted Zn-dependent protease